MYFYISRLINWIILNQILIILLLMIYFMISKNKFIKFYFKVIITSYILFICFIPSGVFMLHSLEKSYIKDEMQINNIDGILVLSGRENIRLSDEYGQLYLGGSNHRITESLILQKRFPNAKLIFSGGSGNFFNKNVSDVVANNFYKEFSINYENIIFESKSTNTYENFLYSEKIAIPNKDEKWLLVTSAFHMKRSIGIANKMGWKFIPYPVDFKTSKNFVNEIKNISIIKNITSFQIASREILAMIVYAFMDRTSQFLVEN